MADTRILEIILKAVDKATPEMEKATSKIPKILGKIASIAGGALAVGGLANLAGTIMNNADQLQLLADKTGLTAERLQELQYIGADVGVEVETVARSQVLLTKNMDSARRGTALQVNAFKQMGVAVTKADGSLRDAKVVMAEAITALGQMGNETERDAISLKIFGRSAQELNPLIVAGGQRLDELAAKARSSGAVMSNEAVAGVDKFGDALEQLKLAIMGRLGQAFGAMVGWMERHRSTVDSVIGTVKSVISSLGGVLRTVWGVFEAAWPAISGALKIAEPIIKGVLKGIELAIWPIKKALDAATKAFDFFTNASYKAEKAANDTAGRARVVKNWAAMGYKSEAAALKAFGYAEGGLITSPRIILAGERWRKELLLPLEDRARSLALLAQYGGSLFDTQYFMPSLAGAGGGNGGSFDGGIIQLTTPVTLTLDGREVGRAIAQTEVHGARSGVR